MYKRAFPLLAATSTSLLTISLASCVELEKVHAITKDGNFSPAFLFVTGKLHSIISYNYFLCYKLIQNTLEFIIYLTIYSIHMNAHIFTLIIIAGEGMRKKKILMLDLDIYNVKVSFSAPLLKEAKSWKNKDEKDTSTSLHSVVFDKLIHTRNDDESGISVNLNFVRGVTTTQVVEAFNESFVGCDPASTKLFKDTLRNSVGTTGVSSGDHIEFYWLNGGGLVISVKGQVKGTIFNKEIEKRLLEVYIDPSRTVSPSLCSNLLQNLSQ